jgi:3-hydroxyacyl-[acyl-carrier-protein] dehydratase
LPGVLMLEALTQAASWVLHRRHQFGKSMSILREARNVKYGHFVAPGNFLRVDVEYAKPTDTGHSFKAAGFVGEKQAVAAKIELSYFNLAEKDPKLAPIDSKLIEHHRFRWSVLTGEN